MKQSFSPTRLWLLVRGDILTEWRTHAFIFGAVATLIFLVSLHRNHDEMIHSSMYQTLFGYTLFIWGIWATCLTFRPLHDQTRKEAYLLLPASTLEKLIARLLPLTIGIGIILPTYFLLLSAVIEFFQWAIHGNRRPLFDPFDPDIWKLYGWYIIVQSPFFLGAVWFRRFAFLKTAFMLILIALCVTVLMFSAAYFAIDHVSWFLADRWRFHLHQDSGSFNALDFMHDRKNDHTLLHFPSLSRNTLATIFYGGLILFPFILWWIAWLRLKEMQASDGV